MKIEYQNNCKLMSMKDINGKDPDWYFLEGNRTAGKTFSMKYMLYNKWIKTEKKRKCVVLVRHSVDLGSVEQGFFKDLMESKIPPGKVTKKTLIKGVCNEIFLDDISFGYAMSMHNPNIIKSNSSLFVDVDWIFMDEFQAEDGSYLKDEFGRIFSIHTSIARGGGKQVRRVPILLCSNSVTILNPYYLNLGITNRIRPECKHMRGDGWVLERSYNESAAEAMRSSSFNQVYLDRKEFLSATGHEYLLDSSAFLGYIKGQKHMIFSIIDEGKEYGVWKMDDTGLYLVSTRYDPGFGFQITSSIKDHTESTLFVKAKKYCKSLADSFDRGMVRFENMQCKNAFFNTIGYVNF